LEDQLFQILLKARLVPGEADSWVWKVGGLQTFSVNSAYIHVRKDREVVSSPAFSRLWRCKVVPSVVLTAWRMLENKLAIRVNLERRGVSVENSLCCLCGKEEESYRHLFFDCSFAWRVWCLCFKWLGVSFVFHINPKSNFDQFRLSWSSDSVNVVWNTIWVGMVSELWNHRNFIIFKRGVAEAFEVFVFVQVKVWSWISVKICFVCFPTLIGVWNLWCV